jgi:hypothetical protein
MPWVWSVSLKLLARRTLFQSFKGHALLRTLYPLLTPSSRRMTCGGRFFPTESKLECLESYSKEGRFHLPTFVPNCGTREVFLPRMHGGSLFFEQTLGEG